MQNTHGVATAALPGFATCPMCRTVDATVTNDAVSKGADWRCGRCGQRWDALRLAKAADYAAWASKLNESHMKRRASGAHRGEL
jgi:predicted Zn finger-like uncharacterized protein